MARFLGVTALFLLMVTLTTITLASNRSIITLCTWNLEHLAVQNDSGCRPRKDADYQALRRYSATLEADIIAFQEVENMEAAYRVFDPAIYRVEISTRPDMDLGWCRNKDKKRRMQRTGFAIRKDLQEKHGVSVRRLPDVQTLACLPSERWGVHLRIVFNTEAGSKTVLHLLCLHLKSGCAYKEVKFRNDNSPCSRLAAQVPRLESWMDARAAAGEEFIVLGDINRQLDGLGDAVWEALDDSEICAWETPSTGVWVCRKGSVRFSRISDLERARAGRKHPYPHHPRHPFAVDHIIMSAGADRMAIEKTARFVRDEQGLSDHTPLLMALDFGYNLF